MSQIVHLKHISTNIISNTCNESIAEFLEELPNSVHSSEPQPDSSPSLPLPPPKLSCEFNGQLATSLREKLFARRESLRSIHRAILQAAHSGTEECVKEYLSTSDEASVPLTQLAKTANALGETPLIIASIRGHLDVVRFLVEKAKVDVNQHGIFYVGNGQDVRPIIGTALHAAVVASQLHVVNFLAEIGKSNINEVTSDGSTALHLVAIYTTGDIQRNIVHCLLAHGANSTISDGEGKECWERAADVDFLMHLVEFGAPADDKTANVDIGQSTQIPVIC